MRRDMVDFGNFPWTIHQRRRVCLTGLVGYLPRRGSVVDPPNCRLCPVVDPNFAKDCLNVDFYGGLGDVEFSGDGLVGITFY